MPAAIRHALILFFLSLVPGHAQAADRLEAALRAFVQAQEAALPGKVSVELGKYPANERIAACTRWAVSLPEGANLWGQVSLAARCTEGPRQALYVAARVRIAGTMVVASRAISPGQTIQAADLQLSEGDLGSFPTDTLLDTQEAVGRVARSSISPGKPVQQRQLRIEPVIQPGQTVQIITHSDGFSVSNKGVAIGTAALGQSVRVRLASGRILTGIANADGRVEVRQ